MHTMVVKTMALLIFFFRSLDHKLLAGVQKLIDRLQKHISRSAREEVHP